MSLYTSKIKMLSILQQHSTCEQDANKVLQLQGLLFSDRKCCKCSETPIYQLKLYFRADRSCYFWKIYHDIKFDDVWHLCSNKLMINK